MSTTVGPGSMGIKSSVVVVPCMRGRTRSAKGSMGNDMGSKYRNGNTCSCMKHNVAGDEGSFGMEVV